MKLFTALCFGRLVMGLSPAPCKSVPLEPQTPYISTEPWSSGDFQSLVVFGDSYTDDSRGLYFVLHQKPPPVGWQNPANEHASSGGRIWAQYVRQYTGISLHNYAVSGAFCDNDVTPRDVQGSNLSYPSVKQYEIPAFIADSKYVGTDGAPAINVRSNSTVYAMWIGQNDLGGDALISDSQVNPANITSYIDCIYTQLHQLYQNGARKFVLFNASPLHLAPLYATPERGTINDHRYWPDRPSNYTETHYRVLEQVVSVKSILHYRTAFEAKLGKDFPGAQWALYDVNGLMTEIYYNPIQYLNGTAPLNITGVVNQCNANGTDCAASNSPDSFLWYDALHPSEQASRIIAEEFLNVVRGTGKWATYWKSDTYQ